MRTVRDADGTAYLLLKRSSESSRIRDPKTGEERYVPNAELELVDEASPLSTAAGAVDEPVRRLIRAVHDDETLGLLVELVDRGPLAAVTVLDAYDLCESDLHGRLTELQVAGLVDATEVDGRRGYAATDLARGAIVSLRARDADVHSADG
ncbi:DUF7346 family protein [Halorubrum sp. SY-15]|jgi:hypothetical protein|uniref:DUF7346 family protein n=1 Tax=Halorubrum sp. SY-15 TaxID=3402277 RepID=UPI003EBF70A1